jgi:hypothetical protein
MNRRYLHELDALPGFTGSAHRNTAIRDRFFSNDNCFENGLTDNFMRREQVAKELCR